jgi:hypothetical protein
VPSQSPPQNVADQLERPVEVLQEIDRRPLPLAFVEGRYETYVVHDTVTGERLEITLDLDTGRRVDPSELRSRDRQLAAIKGTRFDPDLLDLLLRHPDVERVQVRLHYALQPLKRLGSQEADWSDPDVRQAFRSELGAELDRLGIRLDPQVPPHSPVMTATLSAPEILKLADSRWLQSIELAAEPEILDD